MGLHERIRALEGGDNRSVTIMVIESQADGTLSGRIVGGESCASEPNETEAAFKERVTQLFERDTRGPGLILSGSDVDS